MCSSDVAKNICIRAFLYHLITSNDACVSQLFARHSVAIIGPSSSIISKTPRILSKSTLEAANHASILSTQSSSSIAAITIFSSLLKEVNGA